MLGHGNPGFTEAWDFQQATINSVLAEPALYDAAAAGRLEAIAHETKIGVENGIKALDSTQSILQDRAKLFAAFKKTQTIAVKTNREMETENRKYGETLVKDGLKDHRTMQRLGAASSHAETFVTTSREFANTFRQLRRA
jgi:hypothetical protein